MAAAQPAGQDVGRGGSETSVLFELIAERYERKRIAITTNTPFSQWGELFVDAAMTVAAVDRLAALDDPRDERRALPAPRSSSGAGAGKNPQRATSRQGVRLNSPPAPPRFPPGARSRHYITAPNCHGTNSFCP